MKLYILRLMVRSENALIRRRDDFADSFVEGSQELMLYPLRRDLVEYWLWLRTYSGKRSK